MTTAPPSPQLAPLLDAVRERVPAVISATIEGRMQQVRVRLVSHNPADDTVWAQVLERPAGGVDALIASSAQVRVACSTESLRVTFDSRLLRKQRRLLGHTQVLLEAPANLEVVDRRRAQRQPVPAELDIHALITVPESKGSGSGGAVPAKLRDLSEGGASLICPAEGVVMPLKRDDRLRMTVAHLGRRFAVDCTLCSIRPLSPSVLRLGVRFEFAEGGVGGELRELLDRLRGLRSA
jgi:c-di-GMP-binding flagellar brake protein YcgR